ncbi:hypothetical protein ABZ896_09890 [Streptomyces sp. NPDC047072]|uniref:hypothetical protein n=1 Tax=Streptomyces sp. NPDC047072 TaxID=3154809 RepID=UPI00340352F8
MTNARQRNERLQQALKDASLTYDGLAADVRAISAEAGDPLRTNRSGVMQWVKGRPPSPVTAGYIAEALSRRLGRQLRPADLGFDAPDMEQPHSRLGLAVGLDPVDTLRRIGEADIHRRKFLTAAAYSVAAAALPLGTEQAVDYAQRARTAHTGRAGQAEIDAVRDMTNLFTAVDERHGGQHGRSAVVQYLRTDVAALCEAQFATESEHKQAMSAAAAVAYLCGWKAYDASEHGLAQRYYLQALALTREAGDRLHEAWILRILAHNGMDIRRPEHTLALADSALALVKNRVNPATEALFSVTRARALAVARRGPEAASQIRAAQDLAMAGQVEALPEWAARWGSPLATVSSHTAKTFRALGDHANAERHYGASARGRVQNEQRRISALTMAAQGREQAAQGHLEEACGTWSKSLTSFSGVRSDRAAKEVRAIRRHLRIFHGRGVRAASVLDEQAHAWQKAYAAN